MDRLTGKMKRKQWYKYSAHTKSGTTILQSNDLWFIKGTCEQSNYELRERLSDVTIGRKKITGQYKILRHITNQMELFYVQQSQQTHQSIGSFVKKKEDVEARNPKTQQKVCPDAKQGRARQSGTTRKSNGKTLRNVQKKKRVSTTRRRRTSTFDYL